MNYNKTEEIHIEEEIRVKSLERRQGKEKQKSRK